MNSAADRHIDALVIGAGIAGISAAWHITHHCPSLNVAVLEGRSEIGGTWSLFRYPGVRCDSDMYTLGFSFAPWTGKEAIVEGAAILRYLKDVVEQENLDRLIRFDHRVREARWSSERPVDLAGRHPGGRANHHVFISHGVHGLLPIRRGLSS